MRDAAAGLVPARLLVLAGAVLWGTTGTAQALGPAGASPVAVGAARIVIGAAGLSALAAWSGTVSPWALWFRGGAWRATAVGAVAVAAYQASFFAAVARTGVAVGTIVAIGSAPAITGLMELVVRRRRPEPRWVPATALAVTGCVLLLAPVGETAVDPAGVVLALAAGASYAAYALAAKTLLDDGRSPTATMAVVFGLGAVLLVPALASADLGWVASGRGVALVVYLGLATTTLSYALFGRGLARLPTSTAATLSLAEPVTAGALGVLLLAERPGLMGLSGGLLVLGGLVLLSTRRHAAPPGGPAS